MQSIVAVFITNNKNESVNNLSLLRSHRRCTLSHSLGSLTSQQPIMVQFPRSHAISVRLTSTSCSVATLSVFVCISEWQLPTFLHQKNEPKRKKKNYLTQGQRKEQDRLSLTFLIQVTICFRGILLCDRESIKQHIPSHSSHAQSPTFLSLQGH